ncbi:class I SAM-dependent methyltransferase [Micromonospora carbonacea]|uniref:class I SAM-dependent methyltransferase n=1 Tax=Micromonospora carbonacea TaxID=47853 RepID=UPI003D72A195
MLGVSGTARWMTHARAAETLRADRLFADPLAIALLERTEPEVLTRLRENPTPRFDVIAVRTRFFDEYLRRASAQPDRRQVVILAAGFDTRAFRLDWLPDTTVYEVDLPEVVDLKESFLAECAPPERSCHRVAIPADLTKDWTARLRAAGFDPERPTAWLVEGLLYYLTEVEAETLVRQIHTLSAAGSTLALEHVNPDTYRAPWLKDWLREMGEGGRPWQSGLAEPEAWLSALGWDARVHEPSDLAIARRRWVPRTPPRDVPGVMRTWLVVAGRRPAPATRETATATTTRKEPQ